MPTVFTLFKGSEEPATALARYEAWLEGEASFQQTEIKRKIEECNEVRAKLNDRPEEDRQRVNEQRISAGKPPHVWPLAPLPVPPWEDRLHDKSRCELAEQACQLTRDEVEELRKAFAAYCGEIDSREFQKLQHMLSAWEDGEAARDLRVRIEAARLVADTIIAKRSLLPDIEGLDFNECWASFGPDGLNLEHYAKEWQTCDEETRKLEMESWEFHERRMPVYYEYARQSRHVLALAAMHEAIEKEMPERHDEEETNENASEPSIRGSPMHPLEQTLRRAVEAMHAVTGGFANGVLDLSKFLLQDTPYPLIPVQDRKCAALHAMHCNESHSMSGPWLSDPGGVADPWVQSRVSRDLVRLADWKEATQKAHIKYTCNVNKEKEGLRYVHEDIIEYPDALNATTLPIGDHVHQRSFDGEGCEIIALRVRWKDTRNSELTDAFRGLIEWMRPRRPPEGTAHRSSPIVDWPERPDERKGKGKNTEIESALHALIKLRIKRAIEIAERTPLNDEDLKIRRELLKRLPELKKRFKELKWRAKDRATATACFKLRTMDESPPWWEEDQTDNKSK